MFQVDVRHEGLNKFRRISGGDKYVVEQRAKAQVAIWDEQWARKCASEQKRNHAQLLFNNAEGNKARAIQQTEAAQKVLSELQSILVSGLKIETWFDWNSLYSRELFSEPAPTSATPHAIPREPSPKDTEFQPEWNILSVLLPALRRRYEQAAQQRFEQTHSTWKSEVADIARQNSAAQDSYRASLKKWEMRRAKFQEHQRTGNERVDQLRLRYANKDQDAVVEFIDMVLMNSRYPDIFPKQWSIDLISETGVLVVDYELPAATAFPRTKAVKYVQSRNALEESYLRDSEISQIYDGAMYQTCLRTFHEVFESDAANAIQAITWNGWVNFVDKSNGKQARSCIMSVQVAKPAFQQINLTGVEPKACFRALKGVGSAKLSGMAAVVPILRLNKDDSRFVAPHDVIDTVAEATNIAAISWEEFEYLVRDLFEKVFSTNGGEVKITRANRDHGVDAIAFDPDPIRGGKIVIQAKRYTNVVGVSAVRDLYGTLINAGANRGILVTTSQYGPDSYAFANGKPITLLDGGNLLSMLEQHGHKARIDLAEAKRLGAERDQR
jgi:restriction system protein